MPRRAAITRRPLIPDPVYDNSVVTQLINKVLRDGKKSVAERTVYDSLERIRDRTGRDPVQVMEEAIRNGATPEEIDDLMQEMQDALNDYMREQAERNGAAADQGADNPQTSQNGQGLQMSQDQLNQMLKKKKVLLKL